MKRVFLIAIVFFLATEESGAVEVNTVSLSEKPTFSIVEDSIAMFTSRIKADPKDHDAYLNRGIVYFNQKKYTLAISDLTRSLELMPEYLYGNAYYYRASIYLEQKKYETALTDANRFVELTQHSRVFSEALILRAKIYCKLGLKSMAKADERRAVEEDGEVTSPCN